MIVLEESFRERCILWEVPVEKADSEANLGLGHFLCGHNRELESPSATSKHGAAKR